MKRRLEEERLRSRGTFVAQDFEKSLPEDIWDSSDQMQAEEFESFEEEVVDRATAAQTIQELEAEIAELAFLEEQALQLRNSNQDRKWDELSTLLQETPVMRDAEGNQRKLIIFTEHRDTLHYLERKIRNLLGSEESVVLIHGGVHRDERRKVFDDKSLKDLLIEAIRYGDDPERREELRRKIEGASTPST